MVNHLCWRHPSLSLALRAQWIVTQKQPADFGPLVAVAASGRAGPVIRWADRLVFLVLVAITILFSGSVRTASFAAGARDSVRHGDSIRPAILPPLFIP